MHAWAHHGASPPSLPHRWVPKSYERLAEVVRAIGHSKAQQRALPILTRAELRAAVEAAGQESLTRMCSDPLLLQRGVDYLEAVGDVMSDPRLDVLLLDPVGWFAAFLAHFIRDDGNPPAEIVRGIVTLSDVVRALRHEYTAPEQQVPEVMSLVCNLELCIELCALERTGEAGAGSYLFPCLLPAATPAEVAAHWPVGSCPIPHPVLGAAACAQDGAALVVRGHRFRAREGFVPPGLFPTLVARLARLPERCVHSSRLWKDKAVVRFREASALLRVDLSAATLDIVVAAPTDALHFVGAAKGQASALRWLAHLVRQMLARAYSQIVFDETWLCPSPSCHGLPLTKPGTGQPVVPAAEVGPGFGVYRGTEFELQPIKMRAGHVCEDEGCWHFLGTGHSKERLDLCTPCESSLCTGCGQTPYFRLEAGR